MPSTRIALTLEQCWHRVPGGTATSVLELIRALRTYHPELDLVGVAARHADPPPEPWRPPIPVRHLPVPRPLLYETWQHLRWPDVESATGRVDVTHATTIIVPGSRAPLVVTIHDLAFLHAPEHFTRHGVRVFRRGLELVQRYAALVLCPSEATADDCRRAGIAADRLRVVPWGVEPVDVTEEAVEEVRSRHGLARPYVLFTGTVEPRKNLRGVLAAFADLDRDDLDLVIAGPSGWNEDLDTLVARSGVTPRRLGFVDAAELPALYAGAEVFCAPSLREGFGLPVLEAMAQGTVVVASAGTSSEEIVGNAGVLVDPLDVGAIADGLRRALADDGTLAAAGRARAGDFSPRRTADLHAAAYRELAA